MEGRRFCWSWIVCWSCSCPDCLLVLDKTTKVIIVIIIKLAHWLLHVISWEISQTHFTDFSVFTLSLTIRGENHTFMFCFLGIEKLYKLAIFLVGKQTRYARVERKRELDMLGNVEFLNYEPTADWDMLAYERLWWLAFVSVFALAFARGALPLNQPCHSLTNKQVWELSL